MEKLKFILSVVMIAVVSTAIISCNSAGKASAAKVLKFNLEKGKGYDYEIVWDMKMGMMGRDNNISIGAMYSMNVTDVKDGVRTMTGMYRSFRMNMDMMGQKIDIDTDKPSIESEDDKSGAIPVGMMNKVFSGIVGKSFTMKVDQEGNILEVSGFEELIGSMMESIGIDEDKKAAMMASLKDQFNEEEIRNQFSDMFMIFPNKEVKVGDSWEKGFTKGGKMAAKFNTAYTVKEIEGDFITLDAKTKISSGGEADMSGEQTGTVTVDSKTGLMVNGDFKQSLKAKTQGFEINIDGKGKIKGKAN